MIGWFAQILVGILVNNAVDAVIPHVLPALTQIFTHFDPDTVLPIFRGDHVYTPIFNLLEEKCMNATGDPEHFPKVLDKMISINQCMNEIINETAIMIKYEELEPLGQIHAYFNRTCRQQERFRNCSQGVNPIEVCLTAEELAQKQINLNIASSSFTYFCENDGELFTGFLTEPGKTCLIEKNDQLSGCGANIFKKLFTGRITELIPKLLCSDINEFHECALPILKQCESQNVAETLLGYANVLRREMHCY